MGMVIGEGEAVTWDIIVVQSDKIFHHYERGDGCIRCRYGCRNDVGLGIVEGIVMTGVMWQLKIDIP